MGFIELSTTETKEYYDNLGKQILSSSVLHQTYFPTPFYAPIAYMNGGNNQKIWYLYDSSQRRTSPDYFISNMIPWGLFVPKTKLNYGDDRLTYHIQYDDDGNRIYEGWEIQSSYPTDMDLSWNASQNTETDTHHVYTAGFGVLCGAEAWQLLPYGKSIPRIANLLNLGGLRGFGEILPNA